MDYDDTPEEANFRAEFRAWLQRNDPGPAPASSDSVAEQAFRMSWHRALYRGGWLGLSWPEQWGGRGKSPLLEAIVNEELGTAGIPNSVGPLGWLGRALLLFGNDDQRRRFLMPLLKGESQWCQGFSEPGAGSDLAGISSYAKRDGSSYRISGQKLWTSGAQFAEWCMVLVKTDRTVAKHKGISCFVIAMDIPGITVRTLRQSWGGERFCEVFFDEAEALEENRLGDEGDGWALANTVLSYERGPSEIGVVATWKSELARLAMHANDEPVDRDQVRRDEGRRRSVPTSVDGEPLEAEHRRTARTGVFGRQAAHDPSRAGVGVLGDGCRTSIRDHRSRPRCR